MSFNELLWHSYLSNSFYYILVQLDARTVIYPPPPLPPRPRSLATEGRMYRPAFPRLCASLLLCLVDGKGQTRRREWGPCRLAGAGTEGTLARPGRWAALPQLDCPRVQMLVLRAAQRCTHSLPGAPRIWIFLSGLLSCNDTNLDVVEVGTFANLSW